MQFQNILIPTDFSGSAEQAVQHALTLAAREQAQILLLHVLPLWRSLARGTGGRQPRSNGYKTSHAKPLFRCTPSSYGAIPPPRSAAWPRNAIAI